MARVVIEVQGGFVVAVYADSPEVEAEVVDRDLRVIFKEQFVEEQYGGEAQPEIDRKQVPFEVWP